MSHSPEGYYEPWIFVKDGEGWGDNGDTPVLWTNMSGQRKYPFVFPERIARRMAACVNACKGVPTEALECGSVEIIVRGGQRAGKTLPETD